MKIINKSYEELSKTIAVEIIELIKEKPDACICLPSGETPLVLFNYLAELLPTVNYQKIKFVQLDEFVGLGVNDDGSCAYMLERDFFAQINVNNEQKYFVDGKSNRVVSDFEKIANEQAIDYIVLGVGQNGHIGLNEPHVNTDENYAYVELDEVTRKVMKKYFKQGAKDITHGVTLSIKKIKKSSKIAVLINGEHKREISKRILDGEKLPVTEILDGSNATLYLDENSVNLKGEK